MQTPEIEFYRLSFTMKFKQKTILPNYKGAIFRGAFGKHFRHISWVTHLDSCEFCPYKNECAYFYIFETEMP